MSWSADVTEAVVCLGSNVGDRSLYLRSALEMLADMPATRFLRASSVSETEPVGVPAGFENLKFLNQIALFATELSPEEFSRRMHAVEDKLGRLRVIKNGPRTIDIDLIDFGGIKRNTPELVLPHPRALERDFVIRPLKEIGFDIEKLSSCFREE